MPSGERKQNQQNWPHALVLWKDFVNRLDVFREIANDCILGRAWSRVVCLGAAQCTCRFSISLCGNMETMNMNACAKLMQKRKHSPPTDVAWVRFLSRCYIWFSFVDSSLGRLNNDNDNYDFDKLEITWSRIFTVVLDTDSNTQQFLDWGHRGRRFPSSARHNWEKRPKGEEWHEADHMQSRISHCTCNKHLERLLNDSRKSNSKVISPNSYGRIKQSDEPVRIF